MTDSTTRREELYDLHGVRLDAYDAIVRPDQVLPIRVYTLRRWTPILGATGFWLLTTLQQLSYRNPKGHNWCTVSREALASEANLSEATVHRYLHADEYTLHGLCHWVCLPNAEETHQRRRWSSRAGRMTQAINRYTVVMDAPLAPVDQRGLAQFLQDRKDDVESALGYLASLSLADLLSMMDDCAARFRSFDGDGDGWDECAFYPTVADVVQAIGVSLPEHEKERTQFLSLCSRVQQAFMGQVYLGTQYFCRQWTPILGHKLALVVTQLRSHCFWNEDTLRDEVSIGTKDLAKASGCNPGWLRKAYKKDWAQHFFVVTEQGRGKQPQFRVVLREPLAPQDKAEYQALLNAGGIDPESGQLGLPEPSPKALVNAPDERLGTEQTSVVNVSESTNAPGERLGTEQTRLVNVSEPTNAPGERLGTGQTRLVNALESANAPGEQHVSTIRNTLCVNTLFFLSLKQQKHARDSATAALLEEFEIGSPSNSQILSLGPNPNDVRAWMLYALTQPGLRTDAGTGPEYVVNDAGRGYVVNRLKAKDTPPDRFQRWAKLVPDEWHLLWRADHYGGPYVAALPPTLTSALDAWHDDFGSVFPRGPFRDGVIDWSALSDVLVQQLEGLPDGFNLIEHRNCRVEIVPGVGTVTDSRIAGILRERGVLHDVFCRVPSLSSSSKSDADDSPSNGNSKLWQMALSELQLQMTQATFDAWLRGSHLLQYDDKDGVFVIGVKNNLAKDWLENRLLTTITRTLCRLLVDRTAVSEVSFVALDSDG